MENALKGLEAWYSSQCDGEWEHGYGVTIDTLDNPGWKVEIDLRGTHLEEKHFESFESDRTETDWIFCKIENAKFVAHGGPGNFSEIIERFLSWVDNVDVDRLR